MAQFRTNVVPEVEEVGAECTANINAECGAKVHGQSPFFVAGLLGLLGGGIGVIIKVERTQVESHPRRPSPSL